MLFGWGNTPRRPSPEVSCLLPADLLRDPGATHASNHGNSGEVKKNNKFVSCWLLFGAWVGWVLFFFFKITRSLNNTYTFLSVLGKRPRQQLPPDV